MEWASGPLDSESSSFPRVDGVGGEGRVQPVSIPRIVSFPDQKSKKRVFRRGLQKAGTARFTPHTMIDATRLRVNEIAGI